MTVVDTERTPDAQTDVQVDGRRRRRETNRQAVVDALLAMYDAGVLEPNIGEVAEAAGLSARSVFRYFDDIDDLVRAAIAHQQMRLAPLVPLEIDLATPLNERVAAVVTHRVRLLEAMGNVGRVARRRGDAQPLVAAELTRMRGELRRQLAEAFAPELGGDDHRLAALDVLCSFEAHDLLMGDHGLDRQDVVEAMTAGVSALVGARA